ncbi:MAG: carboxypeptidase M32 [Phycisphaerales bacterium]|nr:carboxypeptidase M32 [Phycisphaerales bacterium]
MTTTSATNTAYKTLSKAMYNAALLGSTAALLGWEQETYMPNGGREHRANQLAQLAGMTHKMITAAEIGELLSTSEADASLAGEPTSESAVNLREWRRAYDRATKLPQSLVEEITKTQSLSQGEWAKARAESDFSRFQPWLEKILDLTRQKAECYGYPSDGEPYDALLEEYEPGATAAQIERIFTPLRDRLTPFVAEIAASTSKPAGVLHEIQIPKEDQKALSRFVSESLGFDFGRGRIDETTHPFCSTVGIGDTRITTRYRDDNFADALGSTMHETGHAIYEQGLRGECFGMPMGSTVSLGIHESQSRMWENQVGRSIAFWEWFAPHAKRILGVPALDAFTAERMYRDANIVEPSYIRVEADEATYNMHIMLRFELERALLRGDLSVKDLPAAWNRKFKEYLGIDVPDDRRGCLQDVHWAFGLMGYFPTYTLGNLYSAQFFETIKEQIPDLDDQFRRGEFSDLKSWLNQHIHRQGMRYHAGDLCTHLTGKELGADPLMRHLEGKLRPIYGI